MTLSQTKVQAYYDGFGKKQDSQGFYEDPPVEDMLEHAAFDQASVVFEFGCGTGRLAKLLLDEHLPSSASYAGIDLSPVMVELAREKLASFGERARVEKSDGAIHFPLADGSADRVVSCYVLDLLPEEKAQQAIDEARRVLKPGGKLCLVSLTEGANLPSRIVAGLWKGVYRMNASWVGGCRPIRLEHYVDDKQWEIEYKTVLTPWGVPSEVLIAAKR